MADEEDANRVVHPSSGETVLMQASKVGDEAEVRRLLDAGAQVDAVDAWTSTTALMSACREGHEATALALIAAGARLDAVNKYGESALMFACGNGYETTARALLEAGADTRLKATGGVWEGLSAADLARSFDEREDLVALFDRG